MNPNTALQLEELRQRAGLGGSTSGIGADIANSQSPANPLTQPGLSASPQGGAAGNPSTPSVNGLKQQKGEALILVNALKQRLQALTKRGE